jgi:hypothetical protein
MNCVVAFFWVSESVFGGIGDDGWIVVSGFFYFISRHLFCFRFLSPPPFSEEQTPTPKKSIKTFIPTISLEQHANQAFWGRAKSGGWCEQRPGARGGGPPLTLGTPQSKIHLTSEYNSSQGFKPWVTRFGLERALQVSCRIG